MDVESFIKAVGPRLREQGFNKSSSTWRKDQGESVAVFNVQKSQWESSTCYINLGTYFRAIGAEAAPTVNRCHVQVRLPVGRPQDVVLAAIAWFQARSSLQRAAKLANEDSRKGLVCKKLRNVRLT